MKKKLAKEVLIFWVSLTVMVVAYLVTYGVVEAIVYFKNREVITHNSKLEKLYGQKIAERDSLEKIPLFDSTLEERNMNEGKRQVLFNELVKNGYYDKSFSAFKNQYCYDIKEQRKLFTQASKVFNLGNFDEFQEKLAGDFRNPKWRDSQQRVENIRKELAEISLSTKLEVQNLVSMKYFVIGWFLLTYPLRGIFLSILWAIKTVKEK